MSYGLRARIPSHGHALNSRDLYDQLIACYFLVVMVVLIVVTHVELLPTGHLSIASPHVTNGDEPHYLLVLNSILFDHDLELQDDYERANGGPETGGIELPDHHTILVNRHTRKHGIWFYDHWDPDLQPGPDVYEVSAHPVAYPALLAALIAPFRPKIENVQNDVNVVVILICWAATVLTFRLARQVGLGPGAALLAASLLVFASPWLAYSRSFFAEPAIGVSAVAALLALESDRPLLAALLAATAFLFKPSMGVIGAGFVIEQMVERRWPAAFGMALVLGVIGVGLLAFNYWLAATPIIAGTWSGPWPLGPNTATDLRPLKETLLGGPHGLLVWCPWTIFALLPLAVALCRPSLTPKVINHMRFPVSLHLALLSYWSIGPGACYGPRHWVPFLPWMAVAAVKVVHRSRIFWQIVFWMVTAVSIAISILGALRYPQLYSLSPWHLLPSSG